MKCFKLIWITNKLRKLRVIFSEPKSSPMATVTPSNWLAKYSSLFILLISKLERFSWLLSKMIRNLNSKMMKVFNPKWMNSSRNRPIHQIQKFKTSKRLNLEIISHMEIKNLFTKALQILKQLINSIRINMGILLMILSNNSYKVKMHVHLNSSIKNTTLIKRLWWVHVSTNQMIHKDLEMVPMSSHLS